MKGKRQNGKKGEARKCLNAEYAKNDGRKKAIARMGFFTPSAIAAERKSGIVFHWSKKKEWDLKRRNKMYTKEEVAEVRKWRKHERGEKGKRAKHVFRGGSTGEIKKGFCSYCGKKYEPSAHSFEMDYFSCCEECSIRRLPLDLRGKGKEEVSGEKSERVSEIDQRAQLKPTALEVINYKTGRQGYPKDAEAFEEWRSGKSSQGRGRPAKYHTPEEKKAAKKAAQRRRAKEARK